MKIDLGCASCLDHLLMLAIVSMPVKTPISYTKKIYAQYALKAPTTIQPG